MENCRKRKLRINLRSGFAFGAIWGLNQLSTALFFMMAIVIMYNQRIKYPQLLVEAGCIAENTGTVDVCFNTLLTLNDTCQQLCSEINQCWYHDGSKCLVGGEVVTIMMTVLNAFLGVGSSFVSLTTLARSRLSAGLFLSVIDHEDKLPSPDDQSGVKPENAKGDIVFNDISFKYASRDNQVLNHLNLTIHEDEMLGIVGESRCGKSTVLKLLMQLYKPTGGTITWNGVDTTSINVRWLRDSISYVAQEPVLFSGTIRENLMFGRVGCTEAEMIQAAKLVEADDFIRKFPKGYNTHVGELGTALSGGQKQRIAIARALIRRPRILVLDEATSALDTQSEAIVQRAVESIRQENKAKGGSLSIVVVAHRLSTIRSCDRIVVLDEGHVVEEGTHETLMEKKGIYAGLYESQKEGASPVPEIELKEESLKREVSEDVQRDSEPLIAQEEDEIPDEVDTDHMKRVSLLSLLNHIPKYQWLFWMTFLGYLMRSVFPPLYSYSTSRSQELFFSFDLNALWKYGWICVWILIGASVLTYIGSVLNWNVMTILGEQLVKQLRMEVFGRYLSMPMSFFDEPKHLPTILTSRLSVDARRIRDLIDQSGVIIENFMVAVICLVLCFSPLGDWRLTLIAIIVFPLVLFTEYFQFKVISKTTTRIDDDLTKESGVITDYLLNIHTVHAYGLESTLLKLVDKDMAEADHLTNRRVWRGAAGQVIVQFTPSLFAAIVLGFGAYMMDRGWITYLQLFTVFMASTSAANIMGVNLTYFPSVSLAQRAAKNIVGTINLPSEDDAARAIKKEGHNGDITFTNVSFKYPTRPDIPILKDVSFTIPVGKSVAFVGPSGCGKSTIISLIQRFYRPDTGSISLGGDLIESLNLDWYRGLLGAVNQEPVMFAGTIRSNLQLGVERTLTDAELEEACHQALCLDFINEMPDRFDTDLGAVGKAVSGGQKQRLALARAILRNPSSSFWTRRRVRWTVRIRISS